MPSPERKRTPKFRLHKSSGQALVEIDGRRIYLGKHGDPATEAKYHRLIAEWVANGRRLPVDPEQITVVELIARFWRFARGYYTGPDGTPTSEVDNFRTALRPVKHLYGPTRAADFGPRGLKTVRQVMVDAGGSRKYVNKHVARIVRMFRWAVSEELVPASVLHALQAVPGLKRGRTEARETEPVRPVPEAHIEAVRPFVSRQVWALIQLQLLTAARPGELVRMRPVDLDTSRKIWVYRPALHKTAYRGHDRTIYVGPRAQKIVQAFLKGRPIQGYLFSPAEAESERRAKIHAARKTPLNRGNRPGTNRARRPQRAPSDAYTRDSYRRTIHRACDAAGVPRWGPHRLRHNAGTRLRHEFGLEGAQLILGHKKADVTQIYAEINHQKALEIAARVG